MSLLLLLWLAAALTACGLGALLTMTGVILGGIEPQPADTAAAQRVQMLVAAIFVVVGLLLFFAGLAMISRVLW